MRAQTSVKMGADCCPGLKDDTQSNRLAREEARNSTPRSTVFKITNDSDIDLYVSVDFHKQISASMKSSTDISRSNSYSASAGATVMCNSGNLSIKRSKSSQQAFANENAKSYDTSNLVGSGYERIGPDHTQIYQRGDFTYISAYYDVDDVKNQKDSPNVCNRRYIVDDEDEFVFDGIYLLCKSQTKVKYKDKGIFYLSPASDTAKSLMDTQETILVDHMRNSKAEQFELIATDQGWCNIECKQTGLYWRMTKSGELSVSKTAEGYEEQFRIESIAGSDTTFRIRSRSNGLNLIADKSINSGERNRYDRKQKFKLQEFVKDNDLDGNNNCIQ